jgi:hypothetical protein
MEVVQIMAKGPTVSPLMLCDRLLTLAADADRAGLRGAAERLLAAISDVLEPVPTHQPSLRIS